jgi:hypothetical protein
MDIVLTAESTISREPIPAETYVARCVEMIQIGTVDKTYDGKTKQVPQVRLTWELPDHEVEFDGKKEPARISQNYTMSLHEKSGLRIMLKAWRGVDFTDEELKGFKVNKLLGVPCMVTVSHASKGDKTYANVSSVVKLMKNMACPEQVHPTKLLAYGDGFDWAVYEKLPDFLKKMMEVTPEYKKQAAAKPKEAARANKPQPGPGVEADDDNDLPF